MPSLSAVLAPREATDPPSSLDAIGLRFGTDKSSAGHNYLNFYEPYLQPLRTKSITLLEIGLLEGASLSVWEHYFPNATIVGADIDKRTRRFARPRIAIEIIDQSNVEHLARLGLEYGPFDIVIEDGSHMWEHQTTSLKTLFPFVKNGGYYIAEDLQTNFPSMASQYQGVASMSCMDYLKKLLDLRVADEIIDISQEEDAFLRTYGRAMGFMNFSRHVCLIQKSYADAGVTDSDQPFIPMEPGLPAIPVTLLAHLAGHGDQVSKAGWIRGTRKSQGIQGFSLSVADKHETWLQYRARSAAGIWSNWATNGEYVGTRGRVNNLTGFSIRLSDAVSTRVDLADLQVACQFADSSDIITASGGGDFISPSGRHHLSGMQIILREKK